MNDDAAGYFVAQAIDRRIRYAMRVPENEQTPLARTAEVAARVGLSLLHFVRSFTAQVGLGPQDDSCSLVLCSSTDGSRHQNA